MNDKKYTAILDFVYINGKEESYHLTDDDTFELGTKEVILTTKDSKTEKEVITVICINNVFRYTVREL